MLDRGFHGGAVGVSDFLSLGQRRGERLQGVGVLLGPRRRDRVALDREVLGGALVEVGEFGEALRRLVQADERLGDERRADGLSGVIRAVATPGNDTLVKCTWFGRRPCSRSRESISRVPMSFGALTETTLFLSWLTVLIADPPLTSRVRTFGCKKEASAMIRRSAFGAPPTPSWSSM